MHDGPNGCGVRPDDMAYYSIRRARLNWRTVRRGFIQQILLVTNVHEFSNDAHVVVMLNRCAAPPRLNPIHW